MMTEDQARALAQENWASDDLEIDENAKVSLVEDQETGIHNAAWVQSWVWVTEENDEEGDSHV